MHNYAFLFFVTSILWILLYFCRSYYVFVDVIVLLPDYCEDSRIVIMKKRI